MAWTDLDGIIDQGPDPEDAPAQEESDTNLLNALKREIRIQRDGVSEEKRHQPLKWGRKFLKDTVGKYSDEIADLDPTIKNSLDAACRAGRIESFVLMCDQAIGAIDRIISNAPAQEHHTPKEEVPPEDAREVGLQMIKQATTFDELKDGFLMAMGEGESN
jgi:hypothetical protein